MSTFRKICSVLLGIVFLLSGIFKLMDPVGTTMIVDAWLGFLHLSFLGFLSRVSAVALPLIEVAVGAALMSGAFKKIVAVLSISVLSLFTILVLLLVIFKSEMECGCFGEAVHLSGWATLIKNIVCIALWVAAFVPLSATGKEPGKRKYASFGVTSAILLAFCIYSNIFLPIVDFTSFKTGNELAEVSDIAANEVSLPFFDSSWNYRDTLALSGNVVIVSLPTPEHAGARRLERIAEFVKTVEETGFTPIVLTSADPDEIGNVTSDATIAARLYFADYKSLLTLNRSNGGATLVSDGQIIRKWPAISLPSSEELSDFISSDPVEYMAEHSAVGVIALQTLILLCAGILLFV